MLPAHFHDAAGTCSQQWKNFWNVQNSGDALVTLCHAP